MTSDCTAGWRRCRGLSQVETILCIFSFRERATHYKALLTKRSHKDKASSGSLPPCTTSWYFDARHKAVSSKSHIMSGCFAERDLQLQFYASPMDFDARHIAFLHHLMRYTHCNTLQHTANKLQHTANTLQTHCNTLQHTATHCNTETHCNTLHHTATQCNTLQLWERIRPLS